MNLILFRLHQNIEEELTFLKHFSMRNFFTSLYFQNSSLHFLNLAKSSISLITSFQQLIFIFMYFSGQAYIYDRTQCYFKSPVEYCQTISNMHNEFLIMSIATNILKALSNVVFSDEKKSHHSRYRICGIWFCGQMYPYRFLFG